VYESHAKTQNTLPITYCYKGIKLNCMWCN
jgi:hypothetical protein